MIATILLFAAEAITFTADRIAADNVTHAAVASGHVHAVSHPYKLQSDQLIRDADGTWHFSDPTCATTCTNEFGHTHWNATGEIQYRGDDYIILRNTWLKFWEVPVFWLPYMYYPLDTKCGFSWMPGYMSKWGAFLLTRTRYHIAGDPYHEENTYWLKGATHFDLRYRQGVGVGEDFKWNLGDFGHGSFQAYYAYDQEDYGDSKHSANWGSLIKRDRYGMTLKHQWEVTERDIVNIRGTYLSDSYFQKDFIRKVMFMNERQFSSYNNSGVFWEHVENTVAVGAEVSGRLNEFYAMTGHLPEFYLDVSPQPVWDLPINYESANRFGYLKRNCAEYGHKNRLNPFSFQPGVWAEYEAARLDTYHRFTLPFTTFDDVLSVVPRVAYRGTYWNKSGQDIVDGRSTAQDVGELYRSILEGGVTFAGRGTAWLGDDWCHVAEPYFDVLAQEAWMSGSGNRPYVFDNLDASVYWEDQFAGRGRNLPYSYYGVTPGWRNVWEKADEKKVLSRWLDLDTYMALQFNDTSYLGQGDAHRLAKVGEPNYGEDGCIAVPGARLRWTPCSDISFLALAEYSSEENNLPIVDVGFQHRYSKDFKWHADYVQRDYRIWDFSSTPFRNIVTTDGDRMTNEDMNYVKFEYVELGFEQHPIDWFAWSPFVRWDVRENELDSIGTWVDLLTDCLGFRFIVEYDNEYTRIDGYERDHDWSFGFYIYLRAFGPNMADFFE